MFVLDVSTLPLSLCVEETQAAVGEWYYTFCCDVWICPASPNTNLPENPEKCVSWFSYLYCKFCSVRVAHSVTKVGKDRRLSMVLAQNKKLRKAFRKKKAFQRSCACLSGRDGLYLHWWAQLPLSGWNWFLRSMHHVSRLRFHRQAVSLCHSRLLAGCAKLKFTQASRRGS